MITDIDELFKNIKNTKLYQKYKPTTYKINWGNSRGQGKRVGKMVKGSMSDAPKGIKTYVNLLGEIPEYETNKDDFTIVNEKYQQIWYLKAREHGLNHRQALIYAIVKERKYDLTNDKILELLNKNN